MNRIICTSILQNQHFDLLESSMNQSLFAKHRGTHRIYIEVTFRDDMVLRAIKYIEDIQSGVKFAYHNVFNMKGDTINAVKTQEEMTSLAYHITAEAFSGVCDKGGRPYFEHCLAVSRKLGPYVKESYKQVAIMHDLIEDIEHYSTTVLEDLGFDYEVYMGVYYLSKLETRRDIHTNGRFDIKKYYEIIKTSRLCVLVKMSDLQHNSDLRRLKGTSDKDMARNVNYARYFEDLKECAIKNGWI